MKWTIGLFLLGAAWLPGKPVEGLEASATSTRALSRPARPGNGWTREPGNAEVPEPATLGLIGTGLAVASLWGRVRRRTEA